MRKLLAISSLIVLFLAGCENKAVEHRLLDIESYIMERPDSALVVLDTMNRNLLTTERLKAHHALLHAMALDKNYVDVSDDSLASIAVNYYSKKGPVKYEARSLYYLGLSYYYAQDYKKAILEFTKAENVAQSCDSLYLGMTKSLQAHTYGKTFNDIEELQCHRRSYEIYGSLNAINYLNNSKLHLSQSLFNNEKADEAKELLKQMVSDSSLERGVRRSAMLSYAFANVVSDSPDYAVSDQMYSNLNIGCEASPMTYKDYWAWAYSLSMLGRKDESKNIICQLKDIDTSGTADYWMYMIEKSEGNLKEALKYLEKSTNKIDKEVTKALQQSLALSQRDYYESEYRNAEYKAENRRLIAISVGMVSFLILVLVLWGSSVYVRRQRDEKEYYLNYADEVRRQLEASKNEYYPELKRKYLDICKSKFELIGSLYEEYVLYHGKKNAEHSVYAKVSEIINDFINDNSYKSQLESVIDESLDGIMSKLRTEMPRFKEVDYAIFSFMIIGFDVTTISHLLNISMNVVYIRKSRMKSRIEDANPENKERFLEVLS